jgi:hypothetical protein
MLAVVFCAKRGCVCNQESEPQVELPPSLEVHRRFKADGVFPFVRGFLPPLACPKKKKKGACA